MTRTYKLGHCLVHIIKVQRQSEHFMSPKRLALPICPIHIECWWGPFFFILFLHSLRAYLFCCVFFWRSLCEYEPLVLAA